MTVPTIDDAISEAFDALDTDVADTNPDDGSVDDDSAEEPDDLEDDDQDDDDSDVDDDPDDVPEDEDAPEDDDEDEDDQPGGDPDAIEVTDEDVIRLPDGTEVSVKEAALRQADYTRKTQAVKEQERALTEREEKLQAVEVEVTEAYEQMASWYEDRASNPVGFASEIVLTHSDPTLAVAQLIKGLAETGKLDARFSEVFGQKVSDTVAEREPSVQRDERLEQLEQTVGAERVAREQAERQREVVNHYLGQWDAVKQVEGLSHDDPEAEQTAFRELVQYAAEHKITDLSRAYGAMAHERGRQAREAAPAADPATTQKKRASRAVTRRSAGGGRPATKPRPQTLDEAAEQAFDEVFARGA